MRKIGILILGWLLVIVGIAALVLPGPGLLLLFLGLFLLSQEYVWARTRVEPVKKRALTTAADSVQTRSRMAVSLVSALAIVGVGVIWLLDPRIPEIGPVGPELPLGGLGTGIGLVVSGLVALALVIESIRRFRPRNPPAPPAPPVPPAP